MAIHLAKPINIYFASEKAHDVGSLDRCFAADAMVHDEGRTIKGIAAIKAWRSEAGEKFITPWNRSASPSETARRSSRPKSQAIFLVVR